MSIREGLSAATKALADHGVAVCTHEIEVTQEHFDALRAELAIRVPHVSPAMWGITLNTEHGRILVRPLGRSNDGYCQTCGSDLSPDSRPERD